MHDTEILHLIVAVVAAAAKLRVPKLLYEMSKYPTLSKLRDTALFLIRAKTTLSYPEIATIFGRSPVTIMVAVAREAERLRRDLPLRPDGRTLQQWHDVLLQRVDAAIAEALAKSTPASAPTTKSEEPSNA
jgi:chromosomal replication initiation ATPase DnaA